MQDTGDKAILSSPNLNLSFDVTQSTFYRQDARNVIYQQFVEQSPFLRNAGLLDIYLSQGHSVEPHWHPNAIEYVYVASGEAIVSILNPFTLQVMTYRVKPAQTVFVPMAWWHWEIATTDGTHLLAFFDNAATQTVFGSDVLRKTPPEVFQIVYGVNAAQLAQVLKPIDRTVVIGPNVPKPAADVRWQIGSKGDA